MNLNTRYLGIDLEHPVVASSSPLSKDLDGIRRLEDAGAAAIVLFSLFEEQIRREQAAAAHLLEFGSDSFAEALTYFPEMSDPHRGSEQYLELIRQAREATDIPIIGSLNGVSPSGWAAHAAQIQAAGADALELNVYYLPVESGESGREVETRYLETVRAVKDAVDIPVAVKVGPYFSAFGHMAQQLAAAGADGLVLFNRFYQPDFDLDKLAVDSTLELSRPNEIRLGLFWIAVLHGRLKASLAASSGVNSAHEVAKYLLAGADVVMTTSALLRLGAEYLTSLREGLTEWMQQKGYESVAQMRGAMCRDRVAEPGEFERRNYIRILERYQPQWG